MASALMLLWFGGVGAAQRPQLLKNVELCNGADRTSPDLSIDGCTALINSGAQTPQSLVIAYNDRGDAESRPVLTEFDKRHTVHCGNKKPRLSRG